MPNVAIGEKAKKHIEDLGCGTVPITGGPPTEDFKVVKATVKKVSGIEGDYRKRYFMR